MFSNHTSDEGHKLVDDYKREVLPFLFHETSHLEEGFVFLGGAGNKYMANYDDWYIKTSNAVIKHHRYTPTSRLFYHFTTFETFLAILRTGILRFYNLKDCNDANEFVDYLKAFRAPLNDDHIDELKSNCFVFSSSLKSIIGSDSEYGFWKEYGNLQKGVAIELEISHDPNYVNNYLYSKVAYGIPDPVKFQRRHLDFCDKNNIRIDYSNSLLLPAILHKTEGHQKENEVRIAYLPNIKNGVVSPNRHIANLIQEDPNKKPERNKFIEIKLNTIDQYIPSINITKVILGKRINANPDFDRQKFENEIHQLSYNSPSFKYYIEIEDSNIKELYNE